MPGDERSRPAGLRPPLEIVGRITRSSNGAFLALTEDPGFDGAPGVPVPVVYKPREAEQPLWDFPTGTLCEREVAAGVLADLLGWPWIPRVVLGDGPFGPGSIQRFVEHDPGEHALSLFDRCPDELRAIALFDIVANNADRKAGHCLLATDGRLFAIDHGLTFHPEPKLRTVLWDFAGEPVPAGLLEDLRTLLAGAVAGARGPTPDTADRLRDHLGDLLTDEEIHATAMRIDAVLADPVFPEPSGDRPYPWPPL